MSDVPARHKTLAAGRWQTLSLDEQLGNFGTQVGRALRAKEQGDDCRMRAALERALELVDLIVADPRLHDASGRKCGAPGKWCAISSSETTCTARQRSRSIITSWPSPGWHVPVADPAPGSRTTSWVSPSEPVRPGSPRSPRHPPWLGSYE